MRSSSVDSYLGAQTADSVRVATETIVVSEVVDGGAAAANGVRVGDQVLRLNGTKVASAMELAMLVRQLPRPLEIAFRRSPRRSVASSLWSGATYSPATYPGKLPN